MGYKIITGDCLQSLQGLPSESVHCCVTSPPYWGLRDYGISGQLGMEDSSEDYVHKMVLVFREVRRVLRDDGTLWLNLGDTYANNGTGGNGATGGRDKSTLQSPMLPINTTPVKRSVPVGIKIKDLVGIPWMVAFALRADGWYLRQDIIWAKPNPMPESVKDRCTRSHEYLFLLSKSPKYFYDAQAIAEPLLRPEEAGRKTPAKFGGANKSVEAIKQSRLHSGNEYRGTPTGTKNKRDVWFIAPHPFRGAHFATFPPKLIEPCILAGCPLDGTVLDPFCGSGTTGLVARGLGRKFIGLELNPEYAEMSRKRIEDAPAPEIVLPAETDWLAELE